jgi:hypothetical protein
MDERDALALLAAENRREPLPRVDVAARVMQTLRERDESSRSVARLQFQWVAAPAALLMLVMVYPALVAWVELTGPLAGFLAIWAETLP